MTFSLTLPLWFDLALIFNRFTVSQLVTLRFGQTPISVLCHVGDFGCGDGAWTTVMKINGSKVPQNTMFQN